MLLFRAVGMLLFRAIGMLLFRVLSPGASAFDFLHHRVLAECKAAGMRCVDLRETFAADAEVAARLRLNRFDHQGNTRAHERATEAPLDAFGTRWLALPRRELPQ